MVIVRWDSGGVRRGPSAELVRHAVVDVGTICIPCEPTALTTSRDAVLKPPAVTAQAARGSVTITLRGRAAIARLFPQFPDTV